MFGTRTEHDVRDVDGVERGEVRRRSLLALREKIGMSFDLCTTESWRH